MDKHHIAHYVIGGAALIASGAGLVQVQNRAPARSVQAQAHIWPEPSASAAQIVTAALGMAHPGTLLVLCGNSDCTAAADDLADSAKSVGWKASVEAPMIPGEGKLEVAGTPGPKRTALAVALREIYGVDPTLIDNGKGAENSYTVVFGRR